MTDLFIYPTESFYALGADATDSQAIKQLFRVKHREPGKPIALIAADLAQVRKFFFMSPAEKKLARKYWPGALTMLLRPKAPIPSAFGHSPSGRGSAIVARALFGFTTPGATPPIYRRGGYGRPRRLMRIGVRVPAHVGARRLCWLAGAPLTATSANISGQPPTKSVRKIKKDFPGIMIRPGQCGRATKPSTVVSLESGQIKILRPGAVNIKL